MSRTVIRQAIGGSILVVLVLSALLVSTSPARSSIAGAHHAHTGIMLLATASQHQHRIACEV
jgi:hypothetical protein